MVKVGRGHGECGKNTKGNLYFQLKVNPHLFHPRKCRTYSLRPESPRDVTHVSLPGKKGAIEAWERASAPEERGRPLPLCRDELRGTTYPELPAKDGDFAFNLFLS